MSKAYAKTARAAAAALVCAAAALLFAHGRAAWANEARALPSDPTASYRERVGRAAGALEELAVSCERAAGGGAKSEGRPRGESAESAAEQLPARQQVALKSARRLLPARERVESAGGAVEVDNSWLHEALDECEKVADYGKRAASLRAVSQRLRALESRLAELEGAPAAGRDKDAERGRLNAILRDPAFDQAPQGNALRGLADDFRDWVVRHWPRFGGGGSPSPRLSMLAQAVVLGLCVVVLAYVARRVWAGRARELKSLRLKRRPRVILGERVEPDATPADLLASAEGLARAGDLRGAIRKAYVALLCGLGDGGVIRLAQHKTNRDYLDAVRRSAPERLYAEMLPLTRGFEQHWYGLRDASAAEWDDYNARCRRTLRESGG